ncbi:prephenate dehydratase [Hippea maritima]|nr:prephenate dehydratase [Hippea maritima]
MEKNDNAVSVELSRIREKISDIDKRIIQLLEERAELVKEVGKIKRQHSLPFYSPDRETKIYKMIEANAKGEFPIKSLKTIFREIMSASIRLEEPLTISYLGPEATFTHQAAIERFGLSLHYVPEESIEDVFMDVEHERADFGVVPIENSIEGVVHYTLDMFIESSVKIVSEIYIDIRHNLLSKANNLQQVKAIYSHPNALGQCKNWIKKHLPNVPLFETVSTAKAAKIAEKDETAAAIASKAASEIYGLNVLASGIEDRSNNITRFLVIGKKIPSKTGNDKTSFMFSIKDKVGALYEILQPFYNNKINLTRIESRPSRQKNFSYIFYVDTEGHIEDAKLQDALSKIEDFTVFLKILGSYPKDERLAIQS